MGDTSRNDGLGLASAPAPPDEVLAGRARRGELGALAGLLSRWQGPLYRFCLRLLGNEEDARDLAQDAMLRATRGLPRYDPTRPFAPWILRIARNACLNHRDRERLRAGPPVPAEPAAPTPPPEMLIARREEVARVRAALARLSAPDRELLTLKLVRGMRNGEIAERLRITPGALRTRASRALSRLRAALDDGKEGPR